MFLALNRVANGDHSDDALDALYNSCRAWKKANPKAVEFARMPSTHRRMPGERIQNKLPTTSIMGALRNDDWDDLIRQRDEWIVKLKRDGIVIDYLT